MHFENIDYLKLMTFYLYGEDKYHLLLMNNLYK